MSDPSTLAQRVSSSFTQLKLIANDLNAISNELGKAVAQIDFALKNLNLGIAVWVPINRWDPGESEDFEYWSEEVGYSKINGKWGICLKRVEGNHNYPERATVETWLFNDGPRSQRLEAIDKIPALLEQMSSQARSATQKIHEKLSDVKAVAAAVAPQPATKLPEVKVRAIPAVVPQPSLSKLEYLAALDALGGKKK